jgi:putative ABC transport system permease protein
VTLGYLVRRELGHRPVNLALSLLAVALAVAGLVGGLRLLNLHDQRTEQLLTVQQSALEAAMAKLEDDYRKITMKMGFNVLILPKAQNLGDLFAEDYAQHFMPEEYVMRLAKSPIITVQHLLPSLQQKLVWPEQKRTILLIGTRGEVPLMAGQDSKKPMQAMVAAGSIVLGYELHAGPGLKVGDKVTLLGRELTVAKTQAQQGTKDDITAWIDLKEAQDLLKCPDQINGILALECKCAWADLAKVRAEIAGILPDTQVIEFRTQALVRAEARQRAEEEALAAVATAKTQRADLRLEREHLLAILMPLIVLGAAAWVGLLALANVRERQVEIGVWRALGLGSGKLLGLFLSRALMVGALGGGLGLLAGATGHAQPVGAF